MTFSGLHNTSRCQNATGLRVCINKRGKCGAVPLGGPINNRNFVKSKDGTVYHGPVAGCPTLPGWDMTTGFGSPNAPKFLEIITRARAEDNAEAG